MRDRRHHNNKGLRPIKCGKTYDQVKAMEKRLAKPRKVSRLDMAFEAIRTERGQ